MRECCRLRIKDVDFDRTQIVARNGKGDHDRVIGTHPQAMCVRAKISKVGILGMQVHVVGVHVHPIPVTWKAASSAHTAESKQATVTRANISNRSFFHMVVPPIA